MHWTIFIFYFLKSIVTINVNHRRSLWQVTTRISIASKFEFVHNLKPAPGLGVCPSNWHQDMEGPSLARMPTFYCWPWPPMLSLGCYSTYDVRDPVKLGFIISNAINISNRPICKLRVSHLFFFFSMIASYPSKKINPKETWWLPLKQMPLIKQTIDGVANEIMPPKNSTPWVTKYWEIMCVRKSRSTVGGGGGTIFKENNSKMDQDPIIYICESISKMGGASVWKHIWYVHAHTHTHTQRGGTCRVETHSMVLN